MKAGRIVRLGRHALPLLAWAAPLADAQPPARDSALARQLGREVRTLALGLPAPDVTTMRGIGNRLVQLQIRAGDLPGALESATTLRGSIFPFIWIMDRQRAAGDTTGVMATLDASPYRSQLTRSVAAAYGAQDSIERGIALIRRLEKPSERAWGLLGMAGYAGANHQDLAQKLLREVEAIASTDSALQDSLSLSLAVYQLRKGDWSPATAQVAAAPTAYERAFRLSVLVQALRHQDTVGADSLARLAFAAARQIADSARRAYIYRVLNAVVGGVIGASEVTRQRTLVDLAPSLADSIAALRLLARSEAWRDTGFTAALETVATLETIGPPRIVATLLIELVGDNAYASQPEAPRMRVLQRAISMSESMDSASADAIRSQAVSVMAVFNPRSAAGVAAGIRSPNLRERDMAAIVRRQIELDVSGPLDTAAAMLSPPIMDSIYAAIVARHAATGNIPMATSAAGLIVKRSLWAGAISEIAAAARTGADTIALLAGLREALELLDPQGDYAILEKKTLPTMIRWGELGTIVAWARSKSGTDGAYARLATMGALLPCRGEYVVC